MNTPSKFTPTKESELLGENLSNNIRELVKNSEYPEDDAVQLIANIITLCVLDMNICPHCICKAIMEISQDIIEIDKEEQNKEQEKEKEDSPTLVHPVPKHLH